MCGLMSPGSEVRDAFASSSFFQNMEGYSAVYFTYR